MYAHLGTLPSYMDHAAAMRQQVLRSPMMHMGRAGIVRAPTSPAAKARAPVAPRKVAPGLRRGRADFGAMTDAERKAMREAWRTWWASSARAVRGLR